MPYIAQIDQDQRISIKNEGTKSVITLTNVSGQRQDRSATVESGAWLSPPALFQIENGLLLRFHTNEDNVFFRIQDDQITRLSSAPSLSGARPLSLRRSAVSGKMPPMGVPTRPLSPPAAPPGSSRAQTGGPQSSPQAPPGSQRATHPPSSRPDSCGCSVRGG